MKNVFIITRNKTQIDLTMVQTVIRVLSSPGKADQVLRAIYQEQIMDIPAPLRGLCTTETDQESGYINCVRIGTDYWKVEILPLE